MPFAENVAVQDDTPEKKKRRNKRDKSARLGNIRKQIKESKFHRYISHDIAGYERSVANGGVKLYSDKEVEELKKAGVSNRLPPRATQHYMDLASRSTAITNLIKARPEEMEDLSGEKDPSNQLKYSPVAGLLHKYELVLLYVVRTCSSWCRYCYRSDFLTSKTEKDIANVREVTDYIREYNQKAGHFGDDQNYLENGEPMFPIREALLSGGDPMVLSNQNLFDYLDGLAEAGVRTIRIGTKELAFFPYRFDDNFFAMLDLFHEVHPDVNLAFMVHFTHPDELLKRDANRNYIRKPTGHFERIEVTARAIQRLRNRYYVTVENQTPIIDSVNDDPSALRRLQVELKRIGINNHYFFQCREIEGHKTFAVPIEKAWRIHRDSQKGLSGIEKSRFAMSTEYGKMEMISVIDGMDIERLTAKYPLPEILVTALSALFSEGITVMKMHRTPDTSIQGDLIIAKRNPDALWLTGYEDRILFDGRKHGQNKWSPLGRELMKAFAPLGDIAPELLESSIRSLQ